MLEAVNSVLSNASYTRVATEAQSVVNSYAANPERVQQVSQAAPYLSLYIKVDVNFDKAVLQMRDTDTGDVLRQIPSESQLEAYRRAQASNAVRPATIEEEVFPAPEISEETGGSTAEPARETVPAPVASSPSYMTSAPKAPTTDIQV